MNSLMARDSISVCLIRNTMLACVPNDGGVWIGRLGAVFPCGRVSVSRPFFPVSSYSSASFSLKLAVGHVSVSRWFVVMPKQIAGEARVSYVCDKYAQLSKAGLNGKIFVVPSSVVGQRMGGYPPMTELLNPYDYVAFEAESQAEKNGVRWCAVDGSVRRIRAAKTYCDVGTVTKMDETNGQYGFIHAPDGSSVFFNANVVRPETTDVMKVFNRNQLVRFKAVEQPDNKVTPWRAVMVCPKNYKEPKDAAPIPKAIGVSRPLNAANGAVKTYDPFDSSHFRAPEATFPGFNSMFDSPFNNSGGGSDHSASGSPRPDSPGSGGPFRVYDTVSSRPPPPIYTAPQPIVDGPAKWFESLLPVDAAPPPRPNVTTVTVEDHQHGQAQFAFDSPYASIVDMLSEMAHKLSYTTNAHNCSVCARNCNSNGNASNNNMS